MQGLIRRLPCKITLCYLMGLLSGAWLWELRFPMAAIPAALSLLFIGSWTYIEPKTGRRLCLSMLLIICFGAGTVRMELSSKAMEQAVQGLEDDMQVSAQGKVYKKQSGERSAHGQWTVYLKDCYLETFRGTRPIGRMIVYTDAADVALGSTVIVNGTIHLFQEARNDGSFDEKEFYVNQGFLCKLYAKTMQQAEKGNGAILEWLYVLQQHLRGVYEEHMSEPEAGVMTALLLGDKRSLSQEVKQLYRQSGISHILAISGLHISIIGAALYRLLRRRGLSYIVSASAALVVLSAFGMMTGFGNSTMRAILMFGVYLGAQCLGRAYDRANGIAVAALVSFVLFPRAILLAGVQLSYGAVLGVLLGQWMCSILRPRLKLAETLLVSGGIQLVTLPLTVWYYYELPVYALVLNLLVLPFMELVLILGLLGGSFGMLCGIWTHGGVFSMIFNHAANILLTVVSAILRMYKIEGQFFLSLPGAVYYPGRPKALQMLMYYSLVLLLIVFLSYVQKKQRKRQLACEQPEQRKLLDLQYRRRQRRYLTISVPVLLAFLLIKLPKSPRVVLLDVGQGDGIYIHTTDGLDVFIDGGSTDVKEVGKYRLLPFLKYHGVAHIDYWFLSHLDYDHISGFLELAQSGYSIHSVVLADDMLKDEAYETLKDSLDKLHIPICDLHQGDILAKEQGRFICLLPSKGMEADRNARSMVLLYEDQGFSGLFTGDISAKEEELLLNDKRIKNVTLYKSAHHGSNYSNSREFLMVMKPRVSVVSCAKKNDYGHPGPKAVENMEKYSGKVCYTMDAGQITLRIKK